MAVTENNVLMTGVDSSGNKRLLYPVTTLDAVEGAEKVVRVDESQSFTATEKTQARTNIGAAASGHKHSYNDLTDKPTIPAAYTHPSSHPASMITGLADVATSGSYDDLSDKPTIPAAYTHPASHPASMITGLATVATSGKYSDLSGTPTIPTIPASLPANGGNADTVDGKHAADFAAADHEHAEQVAFHGITTAGDGSTYTATVAGIDALVAGASFIMIPHTTSTVLVPKLNVNGLGAKNIRRRVSNSTVTTVPSVSTNWLYANKPIRVTFDGTYWVADMDRPNATDIYGTVAIANGGTGASTAEAARSNLGVYSTAEVDDKIGAITHPTPDWNASEGEEGYVQNRTHYTEKIVGEVFSGTDIALENAQYKVSERRVLYPGETYTVVYGDQTYTLIAEELVIDPESGASCVVLGNTSILGGTSGEDITFVIMSGYSDAYVAYDGESVFGIVDLTGVETISQVSVTGLTETIQELEGKYIESSLKAYRNVIVEEAVSQAVSQANSDMRGYVGLFTNRATFAVSEEIQLDTQVVVPLTEEQRNDLTMSNFPVELTATVLGTSRRFRFDFVVNDAYNYAATVVFSTEPAANGIPAIYYLHVGIMGAPPGNMYLYLRKIDDYYPFAAT